MSEHTPGPWEIEEDDFYGSSYIRQKAGTRNVSGFVVECRICENVHNDDDARLIAAAPELLEALIDCRRALELANFTGELAVVDAAIAKATGSDT